MSQLVPFENDFKSLQLYIELEQMRYADKFMVVYNIQEQITKEDYLIPPYDHSTLCRKCHYSWITK
jgi:LytS/YehU family sensor histidine kinase